MSWGIDDIHDEDYDEDDCSDCVKFEICNNWRELGLAGCDDWVLQEEEEIKEADANNTACRRGD